MKTALCTLFLFASNLVFAQDDDEPSYQLIESHSMEAPISDKEFEYFQGMGSAVMTNNNIVLVPEIRNKKGAYFSKYYVQSQNEWIMDLRIRVGNEIQSAKGGAGIGIHYLRSITKANIGTGLFGYAKEFDGLAVYLNSILSVQNEGKMHNYIQAFTNNGNEQVNAMKIRGTKNCMAQFRNVPGGMFQIRIEYSGQMVNVYKKQSSEGIFEKCVSFEADLDYKGAWLITGASGLTTPDSAFIDSFTLYNLGVAVKKEENIEYHKKHKKNAIKDMARFNHEHHAKDLIHSPHSFFNKDQFGLGNLLDMIPVQMTNLKSSMGNSLTEMYNNLNFYYSLTSPLHNHKSFDRQLDAVNGVTANMTSLSKDLDFTMGMMETIKNDLNDQAERQFKESDQHLVMGESQKNQIFDDSMGEFQSSLKLIHKKFNALHSKLDGFNTLQEEFHVATDKAEQNWKKNIGIKKQQFQDNDNVQSSGRDSIKVNLDLIDDLFNEMINNEQKSSLMVLLTIPNICLMAVIAMCCYLWATLNNYAKRRVD